MSRPSDPLLKWLREQLDARGQNTASLAATLGRPRKDVRRLLAGTDPMLVDDLLAITEALGLTPQDMGMPAVEGAPPETPVDAPAAADDEAGEPWRNQPEALVRVGFDASIDFLIVVDPQQLEGWGGPDDVRAAYAGKELPIKLDAAYHPFMEPELEDDGVRLTLSFDRLYRCFFRWGAIKRLVFLPLPPEVAAEEEPEPPKGDGPPRLRLVT